MKEVWSVRLRLGLWLIVVLVAVGLFAASPASAQVAIDNPGNANNVKICKLIESIFSTVDPDGDGYPYALTLATPSGVVGPVTVRNRGGCVSTFAQNKDFIAAFALFTP